MRIGVIDTETTGDGPEDEVIDLACVTVDTDLRQIVDYKHALLWSPVPVNIEARAVHHITDEEVAYGLPQEEASEWRHRIERAHDGVAFHNRAFDARMMEQTRLKVDLPAICTYRCSRPIWPDSPRHSNQVLRYYLGLDVKMPNDLPPHRALPDALVTAHILCRMLGERSAELLIEMTSKPILLTYCPVGDYKGKRWTEVPMSMLDWMLEGEKDWDEDLKHTAQYWKTTPTRQPLLLEDVTFGKHKGKRWDQVDNGYLQYVLRENFDSDTVFTAKTILARRRDPARLQGPTPTEALPRQRDLLT